MPEKLAVDCPYCKKQVPLLFIRKHKRCPICNNLLTKEGNKPPLKGLGFVP